MKLAGSQMELPVLLDIQIKSLPILLKKGMQKYSVMFLES
jgi:hypothetical protein